MGESKDLTSIRRRLTVQKLENVESKEEAAEAKLKEKEHLDQPLLSWNPGVGSQGRDVIDLRKLTIDRYGDPTYPTWLVTANPRLINLVSIFLGGCANCQSLPPSGQLPFLEGITHRVNAC